MNIDFTKTSHIIFFAALLPAASFGVGYAMSVALPQLPFWVETISPLAAYGLLYTFFERFAWKWPIFRWAGIVGTHDLSGRWRGEQVSSFKKENGNPVTSYVILEVEQTFSSIKARTYYKRWQTAHCASNMLQIDGDVFLVMIFESEPTAHHSGSDTSTKGVAKLRYLPSEDIIVGSYFNSNGNVGEVRFKRSSKPVLHRFAE